MFFRDAARRLSKFRRVLRRGGRAAVSVNRVPERRYNHQITYPGAACAKSGRGRYSHFRARRSVTAAVALQRGGLRGHPTSTVKNNCVLPSFDAYYGPSERGGASTGQALAAGSE